MCGEEFIERITGQVWDKILTQIQDAWVIRDADGVLLAAMIMPRGRGAGLWQELPPASFSPRTPPGDGEAAEAQARYMRQVYDMARPARLEHVTWRTPVRSRP
jgi:hypothetical protein